MAVMKVADAIKRMKAAGHDISDEYSNERCIEFLNNAIQQAGALLINAKWPSLIKEMIVRDGDSLPDNFMKAAGTYPLRMTEGTVKILGSDYNSIRFRYFATPANVEKETDTLPFNHNGINEVIVQSAVLLALNENEYDITQDQNLVTSLMQAIASGMA